MHLFESDWVNAGTCHIVHREENYSRRQTKALVSLEATNCFSTTSISVDVWYNCRDSMFNLHDIFCAKDVSERQKLSALNGIMGLLGSEQGLFIVSHCTAPNILQLTGRQLSCTDVLRKAFQERRKRVLYCIERYYGGLRLLGWSSWSFNVNEEKCSRVFISFFLVETPWTSSLPQPRSAKLS